MADINNLVGSVADEEIIVGEVSTEDELVGDASGEESISGDISVGNKYQGESAYEVAVRNGFEGSEEEWLQSLQGADGEHGKDGVSPVVAVENVEGGHRVSITDKDGAKTFDVMDGKDGQGGGGGVTSWNDLTDKPFGETPPAFDITWDGDMTGHEAFEFKKGVFFVKVSDDVYAPEQLLGATIFLNVGENLVLAEEHIDTDSFVGAISCGEAVAIIHSAADLTNAMGIPEGVVTNGVWFVCVPEAGGYVNRFVGATEITKIDEKFLPDDISGGVGSWNDLTDKPFGETPPAFDIIWDGDMAGHKTFLIEENEYLVKVSDEVFAKEQLLNSTSYTSDGYIYTFTEEDIYGTDEEDYIVLGGVLVIFSAETFIGAMGLPEGSVSNGVWFVNWTGEEPYYVERLVASSTIKKLDNKYLDLEGYAKTEDLEGYAKTEDLEGYAKTEDLSAIATSGSWNDLKDRPFYDNNYEDVVCFDGYSTIASPTVYVSFNRPLTVGATYKIEINGTSPMLPAPVRYSTTAIAGTSNTFNNFSDSGWSSSDVFGSPYIIFPFNTAFVKLSNCTIRIAEMVTEVKVLDEKYLPMDAIVTNVLNALPIYDGEVIEE